MRQKHPLKREQEAERTWPGISNNQNKAKLTQTKHVSTSGEHPAAAGALLADEVHLVLPPVVDLQLGQGIGCLGDELALAQTPGVFKELLLEVFGDPLLDNDVVAVTLWTSQSAAQWNIGLATYIVPIPGQAVRDQRFRQEVSTMDLILQCQNGMDRSNRGIVP